MHSSLHIKKCGNFVERFKNGKTETTKGKDGTENIEEWGLFKFSKRDSWTETGRSGLRGTENLTKLKKDKKLFREREEEKKFEKKL
jgi:hypothetical protein